MRHVRIVTCPGVPSDPDVSLCSIFVVAHLFRFWDHVFELNSPRHPDSGSSFVFVMTLFLLASWSNCLLETIERLCKNGLKEPALVGVFFDTPLALSKWLQRPATHQECDFLFRCQSHAQSSVDDSVVRASSVRSVSPLWLPDEFRKLPADL